MVCAAWFQPTTRPSASIVTTASSAASSMARSRDSLSRTASSARRRATNCPTWLPSALTVARTPSSGARTSAEKNSMTPTTPWGLRSGKPKAACHPARRAASARGKFPSVGASTSHAGSSLSRTRPGRPSPGCSVSASLSACSWSRPSPACQVRTQRRQPSTGSSSHTEPSCQWSARPMASSVASYTSTGASVSARIRATACSTRRRSRGLAAAPRFGSVPVMSSPDATPAASAGSTDRPARALRIVVGEDDALLREGLASLLRDAGHEVVGRAVDAPDLLVKVRTYVPDVAIVDVRLPPRYADDGLVAAVEVRHSHPAVAVLVLSQHLEPAYMLELVGDDASGVGYLLKDRVRDVAEFVDAVERIAAGGTAFDPEVVKSLVGGHGHSAVGDLTERERDVLSLIAEGRSNKAIGKELHLSARAVERHVQGIFQTLDLSESEDDNRRVLAVLALLGDT